MLHEHKTTTWMVGITTTSIYLVNTKSVECDSISQCHMDFGGEGTDFKHSQLELLVDLPPTPLPATVVMNHHRRCASNPHRRCLTQNCELCIACSHVHVCSVSISMSISVSTCIRSKSTCDNDLRPQPLLQWWDTYSELNISRCQCLLCPPCWITRAVAFLPLGFLWVFAGRNCSLKTRLLIA